MDTMTPPPGIVWDAIPSGPPPPARHRTVRLSVKFLVPAIILAAIAVGMVTGYLQKWLWMDQLNYGGVFWKLFSVQWTMYAASFACVFAFVWLNLRHALIVEGVPRGRGRMPRALVPVGAGGDPMELELTPHLLHSAIVIVGLVVAWFAASAFFGQWDTWLRYHYGEAFGVADPLFGIDVGFYVFKLPFYRMLQTSVMLLTVLTIGGVGFVYAYFKAVSLKRGTRVGVDGGAITHLSVLLFVLVADGGAGFLLDRYELVYWTMGVVYGAGYTAAHLTLAALWGMLALSAIACALLVLNAFRPQLRPLVMGSAGLVGIYMLAVLLIPATFQQLIV